jgi:predicted HNH restriction endonuclease
MKAAKGNDMNDLVERLARALHKAEYPEGSYEGFRTHSPDSAKYERMAQAAIEVITSKVEACGVCGCAVYTSLPVARDYSAQRQE